MEFRKGTDQAARKSATGSIKKTLSMKLKSDLINPKSLYTICDFISGVKLKTFKYTQEEIAFSIRSIKAGINGCFTDCSNFSIKIFEQER